MDEDQAKPSFALPWTPSNSHMTVQMPEELPKGYTIFCLPCYSNHGAVSSLEADLTLGGDDAHFFSLDPKTGVFRAKLA